MSRFGTQTSECVNICLLSTNIHTHSLIRSLTRMNSVDNVEQLKTFEKRRNKKVVRLLFVQYSMEMDTSFFFCLFMAFHDLANTMDHCTILIRIFIPKKNVYKTLKMPQKYGLIDNWKRYIIEKRSFKSMTERERKREKNTELKFIERLLNVEGE